MGESHTNRQQVCARCTSSHCRKSFQAKLKDVSLDWQAQEWVSEEETFPTVSTVVPEEEPLVDSLLPQSPCGAARIRSPPISIPEYCHDC